MATLSVCHCHHANMDAVVSVCLNVTVIMPTKMVMMSVCLIVAVVMPMNVAMVCCSCVTSN